LDIDSVLDDTGTTSGNVTSISNLTIGRYALSGAEYFTGFIDEVRIWNRSLNEEEIEQMYYSNLRKFNSSAWEFYSNQSNLLAGNYTYYGFVEDNSSNSNQTETRYLEVFNTAPNITYVSAIPNTDPTEGNFTPIVFYTTVYDANGVDDLNDTSVRANFTRAGVVRENLSCSLVGDIDLSSANYSCTIDLWYFDANGDWNISVYGEDLAGVSAVNDRLIKFIRVAQIAEKA